MGDQTEKIYIAKLKWHSWYYVLHVSSGEDSSLFPKISSFTDMDGRDLFLYLRGVFMGKESSDVEIVYGIPPELRKNFVYDLSSSKIYPLKKEKDFKRLEKLVFKARKEKYFG